MNEQYICGAQRRPRLAPAALGASSSPMFSLWDRGQDLCELINKYDTTHRQHRSMQQSERHHQQCVMYVSVCVHIHIYIYIYTHRYTHTIMCVYVYTYMCVYIYIHIYIYIYIYTHYVYPLRARWVKDRTSAASVDRRSALL